MLYSSTILLKDDMNKLAALGQPFFSLLLIMNRQKVISCPIRFIRTKYFSSFQKPGENLFLFPPTDTYFNIIPNNFETYKKRFDKLQTYLMQQKIFWQI